MMLDSRREIRKAEVVLLDEEGPFADTRIRSLGAHAAENHARCHLAETRDGHDIVSPDSYRCDRRFVGRSDRDDSIRINREARLR